MRIPERVRRPSTTQEALSFTPLVLAGWADTSRIERVPSATAGAKPLVFLAGRPTAERAADAWGAGVLLVLKVAVWNDDRIVRDRTHASYYDLRADYLGSVRRFREASAQPQPSQRSHRFSA